MISRGLYEAVAKNAELKFPPSEYFEAMQSLLTLNFIRAHESGVDLANIAGISPNEWYTQACKNSYARVRELQAECRLNAEIAAGFVPDWPEWSRQMAGEPL